MEEDSWEGAGKYETELERSREQGTRSGGVAEYRRRPVLRQEWKGKEEEVIIIIIELNLYMPDHFGCNLAYYTAACVYL